MKYMLIIFLLHSRGGEVEQIPMSTMSACENAKQVVMSVNKNAHYSKVMAKCVAQ